LFFDGTFYHLWYIPASIIGFLLVYFIWVKSPPKVVLTTASVLYLAGLFGDSYYGITEKSYLLKNIYNALFSLFNYTRNGLFFAPLFIVMGGMAAMSEKEYSNRFTITGFGVSMAALISEGLLLHHHSLQRHDSMYIMLVPTMFFMFRILLKLKGKSKRTFRDISMLVYILHPLCIIVARGFGKLTGLERYFIENSIIHFVAVTIASLTVSFILVYLKRRLMSCSREIRHPETFRAWAEIDMDNLRHNVKQLQQILPDDCRLMAVVKSNAYGHGDIEISRVLNKIGLGAFAVATLSEGMELRRHGIKGDILILGYTHPDEASLLVKYDLAQTVVDSDYAEMLNSTGMRIKVHIKIDTGMHRLGESDDSLVNIDRTYQCRNLIVDGTFTHLSSADSLEASNVAFTKQQIQKFYKTLEHLESLNCSPRKVHIQSSYGILNYPDLDCDYARVGIALYGVLSKENEPTKIRADLKPVLSLKARVVLTKEIKQGESVGYGRNFIASQDTRIAVLCIGYADGIPRNLSCGRGYVLLKGRRAAIIGNICMDQLTVDITGIPDIQQGEIATLIGRDGDDEITAEHVASQAGTITNELLSRLGSRIDRVYKKIA
jgi:alanine racemase